MKVSNVTLESYNKVSKKIYEFDNFGYLKGPNGSGKTTVLQAIQLALLGYIPGTNKTSKDVVFAHSNDGQHLGVQLVLDDNGEKIIIYRSWDYAKSAIKTNVSISPNSHNYKIEDIVGNLELPVFNFNEFVGMTANKLKDWFLEFLPKSDVEIDWNKELHDSLTYQLKTLVDTKYDKIIPTVVSEIKSATVGLSGLDEVRKANEHIKTSVSFEKKEIERITGAIQSIAISKDFDPSIDIDALKMNVDNSHKELVEMQSRLSLIKSQESIRKELESLEYLPDSFESCDEVTEVSDKINELTEKVDEYTKHSTELNTKIQEHSAQYTALQNTLKGRGICPFTKETCDSISKNLPDMEVECEKEFKLIVKLKEERSSYEVEIQYCKEQIQKYRDKCNEIKSNISRRDFLKSQIKDVEPVSESDVYAKNDEYNTLLTYYTTAVSNVKSQKLIEQFTEQKYESELKLEMYKIWEKHTGVNGLQCDSRLGNPFEIFANEMDKYIQKLFMDTNTKTQFKADGGKSNSFSFGINCGGKYIKYDDLSSGERCLFTLSMLLCIVSASSAPLNILVVDDLLDHLDTEHINNLFSVLIEQKDIQVICAGVKEVSSEFDDYITEIK